LPDLLENKLKKEFSPVEYKKRSITIWNEVAPRYHKKWAKNDVGPFNSTDEVVKLSNIKKGDKVLNLACGTGVVTKKIAYKVGKKGVVVGADTSITAIKIAKKWTDNDNIDFIICDAETISLREKFDVVTCQYALFFFPNAKRALLNMKKILKKNGTIVLSVHGDGKTVPFFTSILDAITKYIPDYTPPGAPDLDRFGNKKALSKIVEQAGFEGIKIKEFTFEFSPGGFTEYWNNYLKYVAKPLKEKLDSLSLEKKYMIRELVKKNTIPYTKKDGEIVFPWKVLVLRAKNT